MYSVELICSSDLINTKNDVITPQADSEITSKSCNYKFRILSLQGWISDIGIDGPIFVPSGGFFTNLDQGSSQNVGFFLDCYY